MLLLWLQNPVVHHQLLSLAGHIGLLLSSLATICSRGLVFKMKEIITHYETDGNDSVEQEKLMRQEIEGKTGRAALTRCHALVKGLNLAELGASLVHPLSQEWKEHMTTDVSRWVDSSGSLWKFSSDFFSFLSKIVSQVNNREWGWMRNVGVLEREKKIWNPRKWAIAWTSTGQ